MGYIRLETLFHLTALQGLILGTEVQKDPALSHHRTRNFCREVLEKLLLGKEDSWGIPKAAQKGS